MKKTTYSILVVALTVILTALPALAQQRPAPGQRNPLGGLERALQAANAPALSGSQPGDITNLISAFKSETPASTAVQNFESAILACAGACTTLPDSTDAGSITDVMVANFNNRAIFAAQVAAILNAGGQMTPLITKFGTSRTAQILESLVGGGFGAGRGPGRAGFGPPAR